MATRDFREFKQGEQPSAEELNRLAQLAESFTTFTSPDGFNDVTGLHLRPGDTPRVLGKITGVAGSAYSWIEVEGNTAGAVVTAVTGLSGTTTVNPAYEIGGSTTVATNSIVEMFPGNGEYWFFVSPSMGGGAGSLTVREVDLAPSVSMVTTLEFNQDYGFAVTTPGAAVAQVYLTHIGLIIGSKVGWGAVAASSEVTMIASTTAGDYDWEVNLLAGPTLITLSYNTFAGGSSIFQLRGPSPAYHIHDGTTNFPGISGTGLTTITATGGIVTAGSSAVLTVAQGGTGVGTFTSNGILYGNATGALQVTAAGTTGQVLRANTGSGPTWGAIPANLMAIQRSWLGL
jgi:hypothetical protein